MASGSSYNSLSISPRRSRHSSDQQNKSVNSSPSQSKTFQTYLFDSCIYSCVHCRAHIAKHEDLLSKSFQGSHGRAYLFQKVVNVGCLHAEERMLLTGLHFVADVYCEGCHTTLGWKYERAYESSQRYKEGKYIVEQAHLVKDNGWIDTTKADVYDKEDVHTTALGSCRHEKKNEPHSKAYLASGDQRKTLSRSSPASPMVEYANYGTTFPSSLCLSWNEPQLPSRDQTSVQRSSYSNQPYDENPCDVSSANLTASFSGNPSSRVAPVETRTTVNTSNLPDYSSAIAGCSANASSLRVPFSMKPVSTLTPVGDPSNVIKWSGRSSSSVKPSERNYKYGKRETEEVSSSTNLGLVITSPVCNETSVDLMQSLRLTNEEDSRRSIRHSISPFHESNHSSTNSYYRQGLFSSNAMTHFGRPRSSLSTTYVAGQQMESLQLMPSTSQKSPHFLSMSNSPDVFCPERSSSIKTVGNTTALLSDQRLRSCRPTSEKLHTCDGRNQRSTYSRNRTSASSCEKGEKQRFKVHSHYKPVGTDVSSCGSTSSQQATSSRPRASHSFNSSKLNNNDSFHDRQKP